MHIKTITDLFCFGFNNSYVFRLLSFRKRIVCVKKAALYLFLCVMVMCNFVEYIMHKTMKFHSHNIFFARGLLM